MQQAVGLMVKKLSVIFYCIFKVFIILNMLLLGLSMYIMIISRSGIGTLLFIVFFTNFWIMLIFFCLLSMYIKLFICMINQDLLNALDNEYSWIFSLIFFPLISEEDEEEFVRLISQQSFETDNQEQNNTQPPTTERLEELETRWEKIWKEAHIPEEKKEEICLICANVYPHEYPSHKGCVELVCSCATIFHKKCVLEWFHFNQKEDQNDETRSIVSCPSCRHVFTS